MKLVTSFMIFECQPCGIFEGLSHHQEDEAIDPIIVAATVGLGDIINADLGAMDQERPQSLSQKAINFSLKYEVGNIFNGF